MNKVFNFYSDPGHGWLKVSYTDALELGFSAKDFSAYSYVRNNEIYLEEDCDASKFVAAFEAKYGFKPRYREHFANRRSKIRGYRSNGA